MGSIQKTKGDIIMSNQLKTAIGFLPCNCSPVGTISLAGFPRLSPDNTRQLTSSLPPSATAAQNCTPPILEECKAKRADKELVEKFPQVKENQANDIADICPQLQGKPANDIPDICPEYKDNQTLQDELKLISVCQEIGGIAESNNHYTLSLTLHINKPVESLTVAQLLAFHRECNQRFNQEVNHGYLN
ncbi:MAG: hypothetical protein KZQ83_17460 [gamma proteobacterium symbiont of Taylorina sp.]|nr:hypothetical protein [gamma proteobacterium symbiont of Taylorina sp.]